MANNHVELRKFVAPEFIIGDGARLMGARYARNFGASRVLLVTDPGIIAAGWAGEAWASLKSDGIRYHSFSELTANPKEREIMAGAEIYKQERCDAIMAVGGGSVIDCAKGIGIASYNSGNISGFEGVDKIPSPGPPLICIPTTGSGADLSQFVIVTDPEKKTKISIISKMVVPDVTLVDPVMFTTMDRGLKAHVGIDAFTHALEAFVSTANSPVTDLFALQAVRLIAANLSSWVKYPENSEFRTQMQLGSLYAGLAFSNASLGLAHAMAHSLGGFLDNPHGQCNALLLLPVIEFNYEAARQRYELIGEAAGAHAEGMSAQQKKSALLGALEDLIKGLGLDMTLGEAGIGRGDIGQLSANAIKDPCIATNPRRPSRWEIESLYERAL